jgi:cytochrome c-type biogenesis protein CcmH/NrfG
VLRDIEQAQGFRLPNGRSTPEENQQSAADLRAAVVRDELELLGEELGRILREEREQANWARRRRELRRLAADRELRFAMAVLAILSIAAIGLVLSGVLDLGAFGW